MLVFEITFWDIWYKTEDRHKLMVQNWGQIVIDLTNCLADGSIWPNWTIGFAIQMLIIVPEIQKEKLKLLSFDNIFDALTIFLQKLPKMYKNSSNC